MDAPTYHLTSDDPGVGDRLRAWLDGTCLAWPGPFQLDVEVGGDPPMVHDPRPPLRQPTVAIQAGPPDGSVRITWDIAPAVAVVHPTHPRARLWLSEAAAGQLHRGERSFLLVLLVFLLRRLGWYHVHGGALLEPGGRGWLLAGGSGTGKSTTTALLASRGWRVSTDDIGFALSEPSGIRIAGTRSDIALRPGGVALLDRGGGSRIPRRGKLGFGAEALGGGWVATVRPDIIAFTQLGPKTGFTPLAPREVLAELVSWSQWVLYEPLHAQEHLDVLSRLAGQAPGFRLVLGPDLHEHPGLLEEFNP